MKKTCFCMILSIALCFSHIQVAKAEMGDMGYFNGVSEGTRLPKTTEQLIEESGSKNKNKTKELAYKEILFLTGEPVEFTGLLKITSKENLDKDVGSYKEDYVVEATATTNQNISIERKVTFEVTYHKVNGAKQGSQQIIKNSEVTKWDETITIDGQTFELDEKASFITKSILQDKTAGVTYYKGNTSQKMVYLVGGDTEDNEDIVTVESVGEIYGYDSAFSRVETHRNNVNVFSSGGDSWQISAQLRPSISAFKTLQYSPNEPEIISFEGNYYEVLETKSGLSYTIYNMPRQFQDNVNMQGTINLETSNAFESLVAPVIPNLRGHFAESDIQRLFSMQVLKGNPELYIPSQAMTRSQFISALVNAVKLPVETVPDSATRQAKMEVVFSDITPNRSDYPQVMAAYRAGLIHGAENGLFEPDTPINRQEAIVMIVRALGLEYQGNTGITPYVDDGNIAAWAKPAINVATRLQIVSANDLGAIRPKDQLTKAEGAALLNSLINFLRQDIQNEYVEKIVNFAN